MSFYNLMQISIVTLLTCLVVTKCLRFCPQQQAKIDNIIKQTVNKPKPSLRKQKIIISGNVQPESVYDKIESMLHRNEQFRSYHPHYLHSFSYPEPITPHLFFGQFNQIGHCVFLVKNNQTLPNNEAAAEIFYVNGKQQYGVKNFLSSSHNFNQSNLKFALVFQIQKMLNEPINTSLIVLNYGNFLGVICKLYKNYYKSFIVYLSEEGKKAINLNEVSKDVSIEFNNNAVYDNSNNWQHAHSSTFVSESSAITLQNSKQKQNHFNTFIMVIKYNSVQSANKFKIAIKQFPPKQQLFDTNQSHQQLKQQLQLQSIQQIKAQMNKININSFQYRFEVKKQIKKESCQIKAESQLFKGLSYEYGKLILKNGHENYPNQPKQLYSFSPSRKRFPWGFLWDDGFHCEVAVRSEPQLAIKVIKSWLDTMLDTGFIPRQQNRGAERQFLCSCPSFMSKDIKDGNPPTLLLALSFLAREGVLSIQNFPLKYWNKLKAWYKWYFETQMTELGSYIFRWHDSIANEGSFNSGLDDFPRLNNSVGHVDCQSWMYFFANVMVEVSQSLEQSSEQYQNDSVKIRNKFRQNFIQPNQLVPKDFAIIENNKVYSPHFGYPSVLPLAVGLLIQNSYEFNSTIKKIKTDLDSNYGLTSLSKYSKLYLVNSGAYWKGPVWININYMFLRGLNIYYQSAKDFYHKLRQDLIKTVCIQQQERGYFYENYINGKGSFSYPFTGWTALISIIIRENY